MKRIFLTAGVLTLLVPGFEAQAQAQDLEPCAFSPAPVGMNFALLGYGNGEGGQKTVNGVDKNTRQVNRRFGATLVFPVNPWNSLKLTYLESLSTRIGADFNRFGLFWQVR